MINKNSLETIINDCIKSSDDKNISSYSLSYCDDNGKVSINADLDGKKISASSDEEFYEKLAANYLDNRLDDGSEKQKGAENVMDTCKHCKFCHKINFDGKGMTVYICKKDMDDIKLITVDKTSNKVEVPKWCKIRSSDLETCKDECAPKTVIVNGLEWMTENLSEYGGTEIDGNWYYTWEQAKKAVNEVGDGWRLPTQDEFLSLCNFESTWKRDGRWFGKDKKLFFPALGHFDGSVHRARFICANGNYWIDPFNLPYNSYGYYFHFWHNNVGFIRKNTWAIGLSIRLVRDITPKEEKPKTVILNNLEWMTENLSEHGGTEADGNTYYTWRQAKKAAEELGDGWRLPTQDELLSLCELGNTWDDECKGRWFGENKELFFPAFGGSYRNQCPPVRVGSEGRYLSNRCEKGYAEMMAFTRGEIYTSHRDHATHGYSVRLVRDLSRYMSLGDPRYLNKKA